MAASAGTSGLISSDLKVVHMADGAYIATNRRLRPVNHHIAIDNSFSRLQLRAVRAAMSVQSNWKRSAANGFQAGPSISTRLAMIASTTVLPRRSRRADWPVLSVMSSGEPSSVIQSAPSRQRITWS